MNTNDQAILSKARALLLETMPDANVETIEALLSIGNVQEYPKGTKLCAQGAVENTFFLLLSGQVDVLREVDGQDVFLNFLGPGDSFGELALLLGQPRFADIISSEDTTVLAIDAKDFESVSVENPSVFRAVAVSAIRQLLRSEERQSLVTATNLKIVRGELPPVFLSYSRMDVDFAKPLAARLKHSGVKVWMDIFEIDPGESWSREIGDALDRCQIMLLILSPNSMSSGNSGDEWNYCLDQRKPVIPVLYQNCDRPYRLHKLHYVDFVDQDYDSAFSRLLSAISVGLGSPDRPADRQGG